MQQFTTTQTFTTTLQSLTKRPKDGYMSVITDIRKELEKQSFAELFNSYEMVYNDESFRIVKLRIRNSASNLSKRDGFRLIYLAIKATEEVVLLKVYPKRGTYALISISKEEINKLLLEYLELKKNNTFTYL